MSTPISIPDTELRLLSKEQRKMRQMYLDGLWIDISGRYVVDIEQLAHALAEVEQQASLVLRVQRRLAKVALAYHVHAVELTFASSFLECKAPTCVEHREMVGAETAAAVVDEYRVRDAAVAEAERQTSNALNERQRADDAVAEAQLSASLLAQSRREAESLNIERDNLAIEAQALREQVAAATALADKLDEIVLHPSYKGVWTVAMVHGYQYDGPNWEAALKAFRAALPRPTEPSLHGDK